MQQFASDNNAGLCREAIAALNVANEAHVVGYGDDVWTAKACDRIRDLFETDCDIYFVFNGTAANSLALAALCKSYQSVVCHEMSHIATDECGAPEFFSGGSKIVTLGGANGKLTPDAVSHAIGGPASLHAPKAKALSLTQSTEVGTVYGIADICALSDVAHERGLKVHMDGARFANAVARIGCTPADMTWRAGVDVLSFGGTKNGLAIGEAVVFFDKSLSEDFGWRVKQAGQLASKMRLVAAPWLGLLEGEVWLKNARHANAMAGRLYSRIAGLPGVRIMYPVEVNAVFAEIPVAAQTVLRGKGWRFYTFIGDTGCRLMCAFDTEPQTVDRFAADLAGALT